MSGGGKKSAPQIPSENTYLEDPITFYKARTGLYPSNSEIWWGYRRPPEVGTDRPPKTYLEVFDPSLRHQISMGNSPAPKGHYILSAFRQDRSAVSGVRGLPVVSAGALRPTCVAFYAGRVFYAGVNTVNFNTKIYFTQILERPSQVQECHQSLDPTNEDLRDLLPSDGGVAVVPELTEVYHMQVMGEALYIFARNGVWQLSGSEGVGFRANDFASNKISGTPALSSISFVSVEGAPVWWNRSGIYTLVQDQLGMGKVQSLTDETIKTFYDSIPQESKFYAKGAYNPVKQRIQWLYRSTEAPTEADRFKYDRILNLDTRTGAWYVYSPADADRVEIRGIFDVEGFATETNTETVRVGNEDVYDNDNLVTQDVQVQRPTQSVTKYIVNILDDTLGAPEPPDGEISPDEDVYVGADQVFVASDSVFVAGS